MSKQIAEGIFAVGTPDPQRKLFDELIELPQGTSYNSYIVKGNRSTALIDTADPAKEAEFFQNIRACAVEKIDYIVVNHAEQDHSGLLKEVLLRHPQAKIVTNEKCKNILIDLLPLEETDFQVVKEFDVLDLGDKSLEFIFTPWVHWPETMVTYLQQQKILFSGDFFGAHFYENTSFVSDRSEIETLAKRYYAEIMMPFRNHVGKNIEKLDKYQIEMICPSHGPLYNQPQIIIDLYREWIADTVRNKVVIVYVSMHHSVKTAVEIVAQELIKKGIEVKIFDTATFDSGEMAMEVVDAASVIIGSPTLLGGVHPKVFYAASLLNALRIKSKFVAIINSYSWGGKTVDVLKELLAGLKAELIDSVVMKGYPKQEDKDRLVALAEQIAEKHKSI